MALLRIHKNISIWYLLLLGLLIVLIGRIAMRKLCPRRDGFSTMERYVLRENPEVFDQFYVNYYDKLMYNREKNQFEFGEIQRMTDLSEESRVLDIGSGTGHHLQLFAQNGIPGIGLDSSEAMVEYARGVYPGLDFHKGAVEEVVYPPKAFTHILCMYFTIYYIKHKKKAFDNCMKWLAPGGYMVVHLVNKHKFNPVVPGSNKIRNVNIQKREAGRITKSLAK